MDSKGCALIALSMSSKHGHRISLVLNTHRNNATSNTFFQVQADNTLSRSILLQAAVTTTAAGQRLFWLNNDVTNLAASAKSTCSKLAVYNNTCTNAGAQRNQHKRRHTHGNASPRFAQSSGVSIVDKRDSCVWQAHSNCLHQSLRINVYIGEKTNGSVICNRTWNIQTTRNNIVAACFLAMNNQLNSIGYRLITTLVIKCGRLDLLLRKQLSLCREESQLDGGATNINAQYVFHKTP